MTDLYCIRCDRPLKDLHVFQPNDGLAFWTTGHYGSTVFDPMDGSMMEIVVCDHCITNAKTVRIIAKPDPDTEDWSWVDLEAANTHLFGDDTK